MTTPDNVLDRIANALEETLSLFKEHFVGVDGHPTQADLTGAIVELAEKHSEFKLHVESVIGSGCVGPAGLEHRGLYSPDTEYLADDSVVYDGRVYFAFEDPPAGTDPTDTAFWAPMAIQGSQGPPGPQGPAGADAQAADIGEGLILDENGVLSVDPAFVRALVDAMLEASMAAVDVVALSTPDLIAVAGGASLSDVGGTSLKAQIDAIAAAEAGMDFKNSVASDMWFNVTLNVPKPAGESESLRFLLHGQDDPTENGIYVSNGMRFSRANDADAVGDITKGSIMYVEESRELWLCYEITDPDSSGRWVPNQSGSKWTKFWGLP